MEINSSLVETKATPPSIERKESLFQASFHGYAGGLWGNVYNPGDLQRMRELVENNAILSFCVSERAKYIALYGYHIEHTDGSSLSDTQLLEKTKLSNWCKYGWTGGISSTVEAFELDRLTYGRGFVEIMRNKRTVTYNDFELGLISRREVARVQWLSRLNVRQVRPREIRRQYGNIEITDYDPMDIMYPMLVFSPDSNSPITGRRVFFKRFGDPRLIDRYTGQVTNDPSVDANEWLDIKRGWTSAPIDGMPEHMAAQQCTDVNGGVMGALQNFFASNCTPNFVVKVLGYVDDPDGTAHKRLNQQINQQLSAISQDRASSGYRNKAWVITIPPVSKDNHPIQFEITPMNPMDNLKDLVDLWKVNNLITATIMGMPPRIINQITQGNLGGAGDALGQLQQLITFTIVPDMNDLNQSILDPIVYMGRGIEDLVIRMNVPVLSDPTIESQNAERWNRCEKIPPDAWLPKIGLPTLGELMESDGKNVGKCLFLGNGTELISLDDVDKMGREFSSLPDGDAKDNIGESIKSLFGGIPISSVEEFIPEIKKMLTEKIKSTSVGEII